MKAVFYIETEKGGDEWHARLHIESLGELGIADAFADTQGKAIRAAIRMAHERFGKEIVLGSGNADEDYAEWGEMLSATQALYSGA